MTDRTITADLYEFSVGGKGDELTHIGLHVIAGDERTTIALDARDAEVVARTLLAHCDALAGRPVRDW